MAAPYNLLCDKAEQAIKAVIVAAATGISDDQIFTAFNSGNDDTIGTHSVSIVCQGGIEDGFNTGNYRLTATVTVESNLDQDVEDEGGTEVTTHRQYVGKVFDALTVDPATLATSLSSAVSDFYVYGSIIVSLGSNMVENRKAISEFSLEFTAVPSDLG